MAEAGPAPAGPAPAPGGFGSAGALPLLVWLSPAFPVGAYAYSHGLEWAVEAGDVRDEASLVAWLSDLLAEGLGRNEAILLSAAHRAVAAGDDAALDAVNDLALALAPSAELRLETAQQGRSFLQTVAAAWPAPLAGPSADDIARQAVRLDEVAYPVAVGIASAAHGLDRTTTVGAHLTALAGTLVSAAIRLAPIGQTAGQRVLARLMPALVRLRDETDRLGPDDVGSATLRSDLGSMRHETQYTRIFRS